MSRFCVNCEYHESLGKGQSFGQDALIGLCHRFPPTALADAMYPEVGPATSVQTPTGVMRAKIVSVSPYVNSATTWCGEFKAKTTNRTQPTKKGQQN